MSGNKDGVIAHRPQALSDAVDQIVVVALREICAANAARKQNIAYKRTLDFWRVKHHVPRCVAWTVAHLQCVRA